MVSWITANSGLLPTMLALAYNVLGNLGIEVTVGRIGEFLSPQQLTEFSNTAIEPQLENAASRGYYNEK